MELQWGGVQGIWCCRENGNGILAGEIENGIDEAFWTWNGHEKEQISQWRYPVNEFRTILILPDLLSVFFIIPCEAITSCN